MYGEPRKIREVAERLEARADKLRVQANEIHTRSEESPWVSVAADRMRAMARERRDELHAVARDYDDAAQAVREHAAEVERILDLIAAIERKARAIISAAFDRISGAVSDVLGGIKDALTPGDEDDRKIAETSTPPSGHMDWLEIPDIIPGIRL